MLVARCAAALGLLGLLRIIGGGAGGCDHGACNCPSPATQAFIQLGCVLIEPPAVKTTGPCTASAVENSQQISLTANGAGTCHVEVTFGSGATSSVDVDFTSVWEPCGSDPHGCGQGFVATNQVSVPEPTCDAGLDAGLEVDAPSETSVDAQADAGADG
jgi:hypothetical protein